MAISSTDSGTEPEDVHSRDKFGDMLTRLRRRALLGVRQAAKLTDSGRDGQRLPSPSRFLHEAGQSPQHGDTVQQSLSPQPEPRFCSPAI